ncbi:MAG: hypothetical protein EAX96_17310 [Candidatus Lokiarchaeota archaeon]|nr:hypothetical protein [Candidatus Lokiarchaeota archaeon]
MDTVALKEIITHHKKIRALFDSEFEIETISKKFNIIYKITGSEISIHAKVGFRGWSKSEWDILNLLHERKYLVPKPIHYISLSNVNIVNWKFGDLEQENGIIFYQPLNGKSLMDELNKEKISEACKLLNDYHSNIDYQDHLISHYQEVEVERGLKYAKDIFSDTKYEKVAKMMKKYLEFKIIPKFIHGDARLEHFIILENAIGMIDFEGACNGDPFKDFGVLKADLELNGIKLIPILENVLGRELSDEEKSRMEFFELRKHLRAIKFDKDKKSKEMVDSMI